MRLWLIAILSSGQSWLAASLCGGEWRLITAIFDYFLNCFTNNFVWLVFKYLYIDFNVGWFIIVNRKYRRCKLLFGFFFETKLLLFFFVLLINFYYFWNVRKILLHLFFYFISCYIFKLNIACIDIFWLSFNQKRGVAEWKLFAACAKKGGKCTSCVVYR